MALTRKLLSAMNITDEQAEQIIAAHLETVNPLKQERDELKDKAGNTAELQKELNEAKEKLKSFEGTDTWKVKYDAVVAEKAKVQKEFDDYKAGIAEKELSDKKKEAYKALLKDAGVSDKRIEAVLKVSDYNSIELADDGKIKDSDKLTESIKSEWADFIGVQQTQGANVPNPQGANGGGNAGNTSVNRPMSRAAQLAAQYQQEHYGSKGGN